MKNDSHGLKIAIQAADLDSERIDGTRVYILNLLRHFGKLDSGSEFRIYHKKSFNPELTPPVFSNYKIKTLQFPFYWTQIRFAAEMLRNAPDVLWMPMQSLPFIRRRRMKVVVTTHDLAFKYFPDNFPAADLRRLDFFSGYAIRNSDKIIAVSQSTKNDILKFYPETDPGKIRVIYHGFDGEIFANPRNLEFERKIKEKLSIGGDYILYVGAIQPRKNLICLIEAFEKIKRLAPKIKLVLAGEKAWQWAKTVEKAAKSPVNRDIIMPGKLKFGDLGHLTRGAAVFVLPSLYEGFGIPVLEAFASQVPVVLADNSSLREVGSDAPAYFDAADSEDLATKIGSVLNNEQLRQTMIEKGLGRIQNFSWEKCARETLGYLKE